MDLKKAKSSTYRDSIEVLSCPKCKQLLVGAEAVRLRSCPKLTTHMQKLLKKKRSEKSLTVRQLELLQRAMQRCNVLVLKCGPCQWQTKVKLQSREALHRHKVRLRQKAAETERQAEPCEGGVEGQTDKTVQKKLKKKEKRKKVAEARAQELLQFKRLSRTPTNGAEERRAETPMSSTPLPFSPSASQNSPVSANSVPKAGKPEMFVTPIPSSTPNTAVKSNRRTQQFVTPNSSSTTKTAAKFDRRTPQSDRQTPQSDRWTPQSNRRTPQSDRAGGGVPTRGGQTAGKQQLRKVLEHQQKRVNLSASESLAQFMNSLK